MDFGLDFELDLDLELEFESRTGKREVEVVGSSCRKISLEISVVLLK